jgi:hypothetical protein
MPEVCQNGSRTMFRVMKPMGKFFYELRQYTQTIKIYKSKKTVFNNQLHALEHAMFKSKDDKTTTGYN